MLNKRGLLVWAVSSVVCVSSVQAEMKITPLEVGPAQSDVVYVVSPAGGHVAAGMNKGSRYVVAVDGVEGPKVDSVMMVTPAVGVASPGEPKSLLPGYTAKPINPTAVVFSADGKRFAYVGRLAQEYVLFVDGKEVRRFPVASAAQIRMQFTGADGKNFITSVSQPNGFFDVWVNGEQKPAHDQNTVLMLSRDGSRYAYISTDAIDRKKQTLVIDGKPVAYPGTDPRFTADGKHVISMSATHDQVFVDGNVAVKGMIQRVFTAPAGDKFATIISKSASGGAHYVCVIDGKEIASTEGTDQPFVVFSPDGKRWAARCKNVVGAYVQWIATDDGKKGQEYVGIDETSIQFSPDGSRLAYVASNNSKSFAIVDGKESDGFDYNAKVGFSPDGKQAFYGGRQDKTTVSRVLYIEGKEYRGDQNFNNEGLTFSPDGSHWAVLGSGLKAGGPTGLQSVDNLLVDGKLLAGFTAGRFIFSPNGKHLVFNGQRHSDGANGLFLDDGKLLMLNAGTRGRAPVFSADGQHLFWTTLKPDPATNKPTHYAYADGKEIAKFDNVSLGNFEADPTAWQVGADGTLSAIGAVGDKVICYRVTPGDDTSIDGAAKLLADADAKAKTDADAAKQATADAAAKKKADADAARQAAADARKAAADDRQRQRDEAAAAKKAAAAAKRAK